MPRGPQDQWRPNSPIQCAVTVGQIATGQLSEDLSVVYDGSHHEPTTGAAPSLSPEPVDGGRVDAVDGPRDGGCAQHGR